MIPEGKACPDFLAHESATLRTAKDEKDLQEKLEKFKDTVSSATVCSIQERSEATDTAERSVVRKVKELVVIAENSDVTVTVFRIADEGRRIAVAQVKYTASPEPQGQWLIYYGFNFIKDEDEKFYTEEIRDDSSAVTSYRISRQRNNGGSLLAPSIYFMYLPGRRDGWLSALAWRSHIAFGGLATGLGFDQSQPNVFLGYGIGWGNNVMVTGGLSYRKVKRLSGRYSEGDVVQQVLTTELEESTYEPAPYLGVAFRFGSNPLNGQQAATTSQGSSTDGEK